MLRKGCPLGAVSKANRFTVQLGIALCLTGTLIAVCAIGFFLRDRSTIPLLVATNILFLLTICVILGGDESGEKFRGGPRQQRQPDEAGENYRILVENLLSPIVIFADSRIRFANQLFYSLTGYSPQDVLHADFDIFSIVHEEDRSKAMNSVTSLLAGKKIRKPLELRFVKKSGEIRTGLTFSSPIVFEGSPAIETTVMDITDMKEMEGELNRTKKRLQHILDNAPVMIFNLDEEGAFSYANKETLRVSGYSTDEWDGKSFAPIVHPEDLSLAIQKFDEARKGSKRRDYNLRIRNAQDEERLLHIRARTLHENGEFAGSIIIGQDITEQEELKKQLERDKNFIDQLIESANAMIGVVDEQGKFIVFNRRFEEVTGFTKEEAIGQNPLSLYVPEESQKVVLDKVRDGSPVNHIEIPILSKNGESLVVTWSGARVKLPSGEEGIVIVGQDVTAQRRIQEELAQSKKIASLGELVSGVAHELNNPLTVVMGYSQILSAERDLSGNHGEMAQKVFDAATRSKKIVDNLLAFARKKKPEKRMVNVNDLMENTLLLREHNFTVHNIRVTRNYAEDIPAIQGDETQLQQVFLNLINNAYDALHGTNGGTFEVRTYARSGNVIVEVTDNGRGVPESLREKIFDPFFTTKEVGKGTGLGMSLSYGIMKEHGGKIYLDSTYDHGARFVIEIPLVQSPSLSSSN
jgi:two-component system NtrC family sensor kinase